MLNLLASFFSSIFSALLPWLGTALLGYFAYIFWLHYVRQEFISGITWVLLEVTPPRDVLRSPKAMELFFTNAFYHMTNKGGMQKYWKGHVPFWFSLELVSIDGQVHFYIRTPSRIKGLIETQMYAQYPQAQVKVVPDYTLAVDHISEDSDYRLWGCEFKLAKSDVYPIKTYVDFGLDQDPKEEFKVDPLSPVVELFGALEKGEQMWLQIVITPSHKMYHTKGTWFKKHDLATEVQAEIHKLAAEFVSIKEDNSKEIRNAPWLSQVYDGLNQKITKLTFETGIRFCYVAKKEVYNANHQRDARLIFHQYNAPHLNSFARVSPDGYDWSSAFMTPKKTLYLRERILEEYRERSFYFPPLRHKLLGHLPWPISPLIFPNYFHHKIFVLNVEELATIWHFPGQILKVPGLERVESKEASPPTNLPS